MWGATALVAGTTVGAGILALPSETAAAGVLPSLAALCCSGAASVDTGLLLAEVTASVTASDAEDAPPPSFSTLSKKTLGGAGGAAATAAQLFLQYALLVAYTAKGGEVLGRLGGVPPEVGSVAFVSALGLLCGRASPQLLDTSNSALLGLLVLSFGGLLAQTLPHVSAEAVLGGGDWQAVLPALPVISLAFIFHNVVPLTVRACRGHPPSVRQALFWGTVLPLLMYALWEVAVLGSGGPGALAADGRTQGTVDVFSLLAVATSFIGFALSLSDMLADLLRGRAADKDAAPDAEQAEAVPKSASAAAPAGPLLLALLPPLAAACAYRDVFLSALESAGLFGALTLGGVLPGVMALSDRARRGEGGEPLPLTAPFGNLAAGGVAMLAGGIVLADLLGVL